MSHCKPVVLSKCSYTFRLIDEESAAKKKKKKNERRRRRRIKRIR
jgi:hypothetical protein